MPGLRRNGRGSGGLLAVAQFGFVEFGQDPVFEGLVDELVEVVEGKSDVADRRQQAFMALWI